MASGLETTRETDHKIVTFALTYPGYCHIYGLKLKNSGNEPENEYLPRGSTLGKSGVWSAWLFKILELEHKNKDGQIDIQCGSSQYA